jgi:hypothetical protein
MDRAQVILLMMFAPAVVAAPACSARLPGADASYPAARRTPVTSERNVLGSNEVRHSTGSNAFEIIQELRPHFLRMRGPLHAPMVFVDTFMQGGTDSLREIPAWDIAEIRYLDSGTATELHGTGFTGGIIQIVTTRRQ